MHLPSNFIGLLGLLLAFIASRRAAYAFADRENFTGTVVMGTIVVLSVCGMLWFLQLLFLQAFFV